MRAEAAAPHPLARLAALVEALRGIAADLEDLLGTSGSDLPYLREQSLYGPAAVGLGPAAEDPMQTASPTLPPPQPLLLRAGELAALLGCDPRTARRWRQVRGFPAPLKVGRSRRWRRRDVERWIEERGR